MPKYKESAIPLHPVNSCLNRPNPAISGLSCMLFPFFPRKPHLLASPPSSPSVTTCLFLCPVRAPRSSPGVEGRELCKLGFVGVEFPPRIAETDECAQRGFFRIADVTVIHSVVIKATGSTATEIFVLAIVPFERGISKLLPVGGLVEDISRPRIESTICPEDWKSAAPLLILCGDQAAFDSNIQAVEVNYLFIRTEQIWRFNSDWSVAAPWFYFVSVGNLGGSSKKVIRNPQGRQKVQVAFPLLHVTIDTNQLARFENILRAFKIVPIATEIYHSFTRESNTNYNKGCLEALLL